MKIVNRTCDICGYKLFDDDGIRQDDSIYRFKRIQFNAFLSGKTTISKYDICSRCLYKFKQFVQEQKSIDMEPEKDI